MCGHLQIFLNCPHVNMFHAIQRYSWSCWVFAFALVSILTTNYSQVVHLSPTNSPSALINISQIFHSLSYGETIVSIYEHSQNFKNNLSRKQYYFTPLVELKANTANCSWNAVTQQVEMTFALRMWDNTLRETVLEYLTNEEPLTRSDQVHVIPVKSIALRCDQCKGVEVGENLLIRTSIPSVMTFKFVSRTAERCYELATQMQVHPQSFESLKLVLVIAGQSVKSKEVLWNTRVILRGRLFQNLVQQFPYSDSAYLTMVDQRTLISESLQQIEATYISDLGIPANRMYANKLETFIETLLVTVRETSVSMIPSMWDLLYWDDPTRPRIDIPLRKISEVYENGTVSHFIKSFLQHVFRATGLQRSTEINAPLSRIALDRLVMELGRDFRSQVNVSSLERKLSASLRHGSLTETIPLPVQTFWHLIGEQELQKAFGFNHVIDFLQRNYLSISWNGRRFLTRPNTFSQINLMYPLTDEKFLLKYYEEVMNMPVTASIAPLNDGSAIVAPDQLVELQKSLDLQKEHISEMRKTLNSQDEEIHSLQSIKNALKGDRGDKGYDGLPGLPGYFGPPGQPGVKGERGPKGPPGSFQGSLDFSGDNAEAGSYDDMLASILEKLAKLQKTTTTITVGRESDGAALLQLQNTYDLQEATINELRMNVTELQSVFSSTGLHTLKGERGMIGLPGYKGQKGEPAVPGEKGDPGRPGDKGNAGFHGLPGQYGNTGIPGTPGLDGMHRKKGDQGYPGPPGEKGEGGYIDPPGKKGDLGFIGVPGPKGEEGYPGPPGEKGHPGMDALGGAIE